MKYKISTDRDEILKTINDSDNQNRSILWQNHNDHRTIVDIFDIEIDPIQELIKFMVVDPTSIRGDLVTYVKLNHRNMIFKGSVVSKLENCVLVRIPDEIRLEELREFKRYDFAPKEDRKIILSIDSNVINNAKENISINLLDVSQSGIGVIVNRADKEKLFNSRAVSLSTLGYFDFMSHFYMDPVYKTNTTVKLIPGEAFKIGYKFQELLPDKLIENFVREQEGFFASEIGFLGKSRKFQKRLHLEYRSMVKKLEDKKEFVDFFMGHGAIHNLVDEYLPKHIRLVAMFSCAIMKLLGLQNPQTTRQLTYLSFVHDLAFFTNPKLAQIKDDQHFEKVKYLLNVNERELYFRSSSYAYKFAMADPHAPVAVESLIQQLLCYKTSQNKQHMLSNEELAPLICIFLVSHDLVDYVMTHPRWTFYDYLKRYPYDAYGGIFQDIFDALNSARIAA